MHRFAEDRRFDEAADDCHDDVADNDDRCSEILTVQDEVDKHRKHCGTDAEYGKEVDQCRYDGEDDRVFAKACCKEYHEGFQCRDDEECEVSAQYTEDQERKLVKKRHDPVAEFAVGSVLNKELHYGGAVVNEIEAA